MKIKVSIICLLVLTASAALAGTVNGPASSVPGDAVLWTNTTGTQVGDPGARTVLHTGSNTQLKAIPGSSGMRVMRDGFSAAGDGGQAIYDWNTSNCTTPDNGKQVQPSITGCWVADFSGIVPDVRVWGVVMDGVTSSDAALQAATNYCTSIGGKLSIPPGRLVLDGTGSVSSTLKDCTLIGQGFAGATNGDTQSYGSTVLLKSTTQNPFICGNNWALYGLNFFWPGQTGATSYPPLISDDGAHTCGLVYLDHIVVINAYDGFVASAGIDWSNWDISNSSLFAVNDLFRQNSSGDSWRLNNIHFTHGPWAGLIGYPTVASYLNTADENNTILHITSGNGLVWVMSNVTSFAWRYGIKVDGGGSLTNSVISGGLDGIGTFADTTAASTACLSNTVFSGSAWIAGIPVFSSGGAVSYTGANNNKPAFNFGAGTSSCHGPILSELDISMAQGSCVISAGQDIMAGNFRCVSFGNIADGHEYYVAHLTASPNGSNLIVKGGEFVTGASTHVHGLKADVPLIRFIAENNNFANLNDAIDTPTASTLTQIVGNNGANTQSTTSAAVSISGSGPVAYSGNTWDKPPAAVIGTTSGCGAGATAFGSLSGLILVGSTNPTTTCDLRLPFTPVGTCNFTPNIPVAVGVTISGLDYTVSTSADIHGGQIFWNCPGGQ